MVQSKSSFSLSRSAEYMSRAEQSLARGVGSIARHRQLSPPPVVVHADGAHCQDIDGNHYVDFVMALGPLFLGHRPREVLEAVRRHLDSDALLCGGPHPGEEELARLVCETLPCAERLIYCASGSEALHAAIGIARATTKRRLVVKFDGHYHGWIDPLFVNAPGLAPQRGAAPLPTVPNEDGAASPSDVMVVAWNDWSSLSAILGKYAQTVACVVMEPVPCNFGTFLADPGYLERVKAACREIGALLVFDEIITGYRLRLGGAQELLGVTPDLAAIAKAVASGFQLAAVAGTEAAMASALEGPVRHGGTYNAAGPAVTAACATVRILRRDRDVLYPRLDDAGHRLASGIQRAGERRGLPLVVHQVGSVLQLLWNPRTPVRSYADALASPQWPIAALADRLLARGVLAHERGLWYLSAAHTDADIDVAVHAVDDALEELRPALEDTRG
jgi:glutamate-1-semialdehyde 2,1-aminomutase